MAMKNDDLPVTEDELHAYVDGELPADRRAAVESWLAAHPDDASRVAAWRLQADSIRARFANVATEPIPPKLRLERMSYASRAWKLGAAAAVIAALFIGGFAGWSMRDLAGNAPNSFQQVIAQALDAHKVYVAEVRHPVEVGASESDHLQQWLSKRVGYPFRAPNLESQGLHLVGGRLLPTRAGGAAAFLMYESASGERFTIYCTRAKGGNTALHYDAADRAGAIYWVDDNIAYIISGNASERKQLWKVARAAYEQFEPRVSRDQRGS
jgi:anti-sigma factor RsiW